MNKKAFTFVELIIVTGIILLLSTIGFYSYYNYLPDSRDASRLETLSGIKKNMDMFKLKSKLPIPDRKIDIKVNNLLTSYQGYISNDILDTIDFASNRDNRGKDPKDNIFYTYYLVKDFKRFELLGFLENKQKGVNSYIKNTYADVIDYKFRYPITTGDKLGVLTESGTNIPIQEVEFVKNQGYINFEGSLLGLYNLNFTNNDIYTSSNNTYMGYKIKEALGIEGEKVLFGTGCNGIIDDVNGESNALSEDYSYSWTKNSTPGICTWDCSESYYYNGSICVNQWSGDSVNGYLFKNKSGVNTYPISCNNLLTDTNFQVGTDPWNGTKFVDGVYYIDPDGAGGGANFKVYCDMTSDSGGWTMIANASGEGTGVFNFNDINTWTYRNSNNCNLVNECLSEAGGTISSWGELLVYTRGYKVKGTSCNDNNSTIKGYTLLTHPTNSSNANDRNVSGKGAWGKCDILSELSGNVVSNNDTGGWYIRMGLKSTGNEVGENSILFFGSTQRCQGLGNTRNGCQKKLSNNETAPATCTPNDMVFQSKAWDGASTNNQTWFIR